MIGTIHKSVFEGERYNFEVVSEDGKKDVLFYIRAMCKTTKRTSCINNLNTVLSEFGIEIEQVSPRYEDSTWIITKEEADYFVKTAKEFLLAQSFMSYLERQVDKDRECGEWENIVTESGEIKKYEEEE